MLNVLLVYIGMPFVLALLAYIALIFVKAGYFKSVQVFVVEEPPVLSQGITIFYKYCLGPYGDVWKTLHDVVDILPQENTTLFGIFYDDPKVTNSDKCQAAVGCVYKIKDEVLFEENFAIQLTRWGFERMVVPGVGRAIYCKQSYSSVISKMHIAKIRSQFDAFSKENRLETGDCSVEIYKRTADGNYFVEMFKPLDHVKDFYIPEYLNTDQLDALMARKKFDSEESVSESEFDGYDDEEEEENGLTSASQLEDENDDVELVHKPNVSNV